jgi:hypothetical protein
MNKKLSTLLLASAVSLLLSACGGGGSTSSSVNRDDTSASRVLLSWNAPTSRTDGTFLPVTELQGYRIYYGSSEDSLSVLVDLNDDSITEYTVDTLPSGSYYFAISAYDSDGVESGLSNIISKDV